MKKFHGNSEPTPRTKNTLNTAFQLQSATVKYCYMAQPTTIIVSASKNSESTNLNAFYHNTNWQAQNVISHMVSEPTAKNTL